MKLARLVALIALLSVGCSQRQNPRTLLAHTPHNPIQGPVVAPAVSISATPATIWAGESSTLTWSTQNADSVTLNGVAVDLSGTQVVSPSQTTTYTLTAEGLGTTNQTSTTITVGPPPPLVVFIGDSITAGWSQAVNFPDHRWVDAGIPGQQCSEMLNRFDTDVIAPKPDVVHILCGTNDIWSDAVDLETTESNISAMVLQARAAGINVVLGTVPPVRPMGTWQLPADMNERVVALNAWIIAVPDVTIADYHSAMVADDGMLTAAYTNDGVHPNAAGYEVMSEVVTPILQAWKPSEVRLTNFSRRVP